MHVRLISAIATCAAAAALGLAAFAPAASAAAGTWTIHAATAISDRPDSGDAGYWADDTFGRTAWLTFGGEVALSFCGGSTPTGHCYAFTGKVTDKGTFTTIAGQQSPGAGSGGAVPIGVAATGPMTGYYSYSFYSSWKTAHASAVPATENDGGVVPTGRHTTGAWLEQFFGAGARFYVSGALSSSLGTTGRWGYTLAFGADTACPHLASQWVDSSWPVAHPWGTAPAQGNILAPDAAHC